jgi:hypothetical protein
MLDAICSALQRFYKYCEAMRVRYVQVFLYGIFLILWCGKIGYVQPFFDGMAAFGAAFSPTPSRKML